MEYIQVNALQNNFTLDESGAKIYSSVSTHSFGCSRQRQDGLHECVIADLNPTILVRVDVPERLGQLLDHDARPHKAVEGDTRNRTMSNNGGSGFNVYPNRVAQSKM